MLFANLNAKFKGVEEKKKLIKKIIQLKNRFYSFLHNWRLVPFLKRKEY